MSQGFPSFIALGPDTNNSSASHSKEEINVFNFMLSNACSLAPKIDSFIENFNERDIDLCVITETWFHDDGVPLSLGEGIGVVHAGRPVGRRGGGVGIFFRKCKMKVVDITPSFVSHSEIAVSLCSVRGLSRKIICVGAYLTTALDERGAEAFLEKINDIIHLSLIHI